MTSSKLLALLPLLLPACDPYERLQGEFIAGSVDPANFPPAYRGTGSSRSLAGSGAMTETAAFARGSPANYFFFPMSTTQSAATADPLRLLDNGQPYAAVPTPLTYVFDPTDSVPFATPARCMPPPGYQYSAFRDAVHYDDQGNIFTALPDASFPSGAVPTWSYVPVVQQVTVQSMGETCQDIKSANTLLTSRNVVIPTPAGDGKYLAWATIDPGVPVYRVGQTAANSNGVTAQKYGWFRKYISAYLDGGYINTVQAMVTEQMVTKPVVRMRTQRLFYPRSMVQPATGPAVAGARGAGYDVLEAKRGDATYSPVCEVMTYDTGGTTPVSMLPKDVAGVMSYVTGPRPLQTASPRYIFCLQVQ